MIIYVTSPPGRWIWGDLWTSTDKGFKGKPLVDKSNQPRVEWRVGLACPKGPEFDAFWAQVAAHAQAEFLQGHSQQPTFSWKLYDGDAPDKVTKPGHAGCWVLRLSSGFAPDIYDANHMQVIDPQMVTRGDWVQVNIGVQGNGDVEPGGKPGIYLNLGMTMLRAKGERIVSGPSVAEVFGAPGAAIAAPALAPQPAPGAPPAYQPQQPAPGAYQPAPQPAQQPALPAAPVVPAALPGAPVVPQAAPAMPGAAPPAMPGAAPPQQPAPGFLTPGQPPRDIPF